MTRAELLSLADDVEGAGAVSLDASGACDRAAALLRKLAALQPVALLVKDRPSGEPDLCFHDEREGLESTSPRRLSFENLYNLSEVLTDE